MKLVFVGPTLPDATSLVPPGIEIRGPAIHRDILVAVNEGATVIGLIDGCFEDVAPVWHKVDHAVAKHSLAFSGCERFRCIHSKLCHARVTRNS